LARLADSRQKAAPADFRRPDTCLSFLRPSRANGRRASTLRHLISFLLHYLVFALVLSIGLQTTTADLRRSLRSGGLLSRTALVANVAVPLLTLLVVKLLPLSPRVEAMLLLMAICPGAPFLLLRYRSQAALPSVLLVEVSLLAMVTAPAWVAIVNRLFPFHFQTSACRCSWC
jgi:BASS family bile acid:Na+ symporter